MTDYQNELVMEHLDLVNWVIRTRISVPNRPLLTYDDFYAIGCEAICRAALKYQADSGEFAPFACRYIYNAIIDHCRAMNYRLQRSVDAGFEEGEVLFDLLAHTTVDFEAEVTDDSATLHFIAKTLNEQGVLSPGRYLYDIGLRKTEKFKNAIWYLQTIKKILVDPVYLGWIVSGKYRSQLCERGTKTTVKTPEEEWVIHKGMHEPIVSKELFDKVQGILSARQSEQGLATIYDSKSKRRSMFKGILRCGECGRSMYLRSKSNRGYYYYCTLHENYNATICPKKAVKQEDVESLALRLIQTQIRAFSDAQRLIANLNATPSSQTRYQIYETQIDDAKRKIEKFNQLKAALYGDFADGLLSHQDYTDLSEDYSRRADDLRIFIAELEKEKEKYSAGFGSKMQWALLIEKYKDQESLDAEMAAAFIETLTLFNDGHVEVAFRHRDEIEQVLYVAATRGKEAERYAG